MPQCSFYVNTLLKFILTAIAYKTLLSPKYYTHNGNVENIFKDY